MTAFRSIFQRAAFAIVLSAAGLLGPRLLPAAENGDAAATCPLAQAMPVAAAGPASALSRTSRAAMITVRD